MPGNRNTVNLLQSRLEAKREEILGMLDAMEEGALALCGDLCELRLRLVWQDEMQDKIALEEFAAR